MLPPHSAALQQQPTPPSIWTLRVSRTIGKDNVDFVDDLVRMLVLQTFIQMMLYISCPERFGMFTGDFVALLLFLGVGVSFYWLIFKRIVTFT